MSLVSIRYKYDMKKVIPVLCDMIKVNQVMTHMDRNKSYFIVLKARHGLIAIFGHTPLADAWWSSDNNFNQTDGEIYTIQKRKAHNPLVMEELLKIRDLAKRHNIPKEEVLLIEEHPTNVENMALVIRQSFATGCTIHDVSATLPLLSNRIGQALTQILVEEMWVTSNEQTGVEV